MGHKVGMVVLHIVPLVVVHLVPLVVVHLVPLVKKPKYLGYFSHFEAIEIFSWYLLCLLLLSLSLVLWGELSLVSGSMSESTNG